MDKSYIQFCNIWKNLTGKQLACITEVIEMKA